MSLQTALAEHVAPTAIAAAAVSTVHPLSFSRLDSLSAAFRHAIHLNHASSLSYSFFQPSLPSRLSRWLAALINGLQGAHPVLRLAAAGGALLGIDDLRSQVVAKNPHGSVPVSDSVSAKVQDEIVVALAEVMDLYMNDGDASEWENEFHNPDSLQSPLTLALIFASRSLPLAAPAKLKVLPLSQLVRLLTSCIVQPFLEIPNETLLRSLSSLSRLTAVSLSLLLDSKPEQGFSCAFDILNQLKDVAIRAETGLATIVASQPEPEASHLPTLKSLLFTTIMLSDAILSASIYVSPPVYSSGSITPAVLAYSILLGLSHLSYLVSQLGGISSVSEIGPDGQDQGTFKEMRRTIYLALDILASDPSSSSKGKDSLAERLVIDLCSSLNLESTPATLIESKASFTLSCVEQLVPVLSVQCLKDIVWDVVEPRMYLVPNATPIQRETFESAHSVVLAVFAVNANIGNAEKAEIPGEGSARKNQAKDEPTLALFAEHLVPFYTRCLLENSFRSNLSTPQLCLAFSALVRSASASSMPNLDHERPSDYTLAWYAIEELLDAINKLQDKRDSSDETLPAQLHRLRLALISCVSAVPLVLLGRLLDEVERVIDSCHASTDELFGSLYHQILEKTGDRETEYAVKWWSAFVSRQGRGEVLIRKTEITSESVPLARL